jgi:hypothetical protein
MQILRKYRMFLWPIMEEHRSFCRCVYLDTFISSVSYLFLCRLITETINCIFDTPYKFTALIYFAQDVINGSILCDSKLQELFGCESIPMSGLSEMLSHHFIKKT